MIKFFGEPRKEIRSKASNKVVFSFDTKGEFITDDPAIIERAMGHFDHVAIEPGESGELVKQTIFTPPVTVTVKEPEPEPEKPKEIPPEKDYKICKYCGKIHVKPVDYANCAKKHKKEVQE
jgi:hypothetical protein